MGQGFALSGAAGAMSDTLQDILKQKFLEQIQAARLAEDARQADQRNATDVRQIEATESLRRATQDSLDRDRQERDKDRDAAREIQNEGRFQARIRMMPKGTRVTGEQAVDFAKYGASPMLKPATNSAGEPEFEYSGTQDANAQADRAAETERYHKVLEGLSAQRIDIAQAMKELAAIRTGWGPPVVQIHTRDADGNAVTQVTSKPDAVGKTFDAAPTTDERNRRAASGRSSKVLAAVSELSERINIGKGVAAKAQGEAAKLAAQANLNDDVSEYEAVVSGFTPLLARAVGHTGVLTEQDVQSVRKMLPQPGDSKSVRDRKIARITSLMGDLSGDAPATPAAPASGRGGVSVKSIKEVK
jgi:hypothetical protein